MTWIRSVWKAIVGFVGGFAAPIIAAATDNLSAIDWTAVDAATIRTALVTGVVTGVGVWAKANLPARPSLEAVADANAAGNDKTKFPYADDPVDALTKAADAARNG